jgi:hypothetical protein
MEPFKKTRILTLTARIAVALTVLAGSWAVQAEPARSTATARVGARILAAPHNVVTPELPSSVVISDVDRARGYALVVLGQPLSKLALATGDRDEVCPEPVRDGVLTVQSGVTMEKVEIVWHTE